MEPLLNQNELETEFLALQSRAVPAPQSLTMSDIRGASPYVLALLNTLRIVLAPMGDRPIKIGTITLSVSEILNALIGGISGVAQS